MFALCDSSDRSTPLSHLAAWSRHTEPYRYAAATTRPASPTLSNQVSHALPSDAHALRSPRLTRRAQSSPAQSRPPAGASPCSTWACRPPTALRPSYRGGRHLRVAVEVQVVRTSALPAPGHGADTVVVIVSSARKEPNSHHTQTRRKAHSTSLSNAGR